MREELTTFLIVIGIFVVLFGGIYLIVKQIIKNEEKANKIKRDIIKGINIDNMVIEKLERFVNIKMMSGDKFDEIDMEEYNSINDPLKNGSYRIHRQAIESEYHYSKGYGYIMHNEKKMKLTIYGDENMNITKVVDDEKSKYLNELLNIEDIRFILWDFRDDTITVDYHDRWIQDTYNLER